jgi:transcription initiation factor TFIIE subunit alpha
LKVAGSTGERRQEDGIGIVLTTDKDEETVRRERDEEAAAKRQQNIMPAWHLKSTISGDLTALGIKENAQNPAAQVPGQASVDLDESLKGLGRVVRPSPLKGQIDLEEDEDEDVKPDVKASNEADCGLLLLAALQGHALCFCFCFCLSLSSSFPDYDQYYASLAASAAPSTQHTPSGEFSVLGDFEEDRKPNIEYLDSLNEHKKRSRSLEEDAAERKLARIVGWGQGQEANGDVDEGSGVAGAAAGADADVGGDALPGDDPTVYGLCLFFLHPTCVLTRASLLQWMENLCLSPRSRRNTMT